MTDKNETDESETDKEFKQRAKDVLTTELGVSRRDMMKVAGGAGIISSLGVASAGHNPSTCDGAHIDEGETCDDCGKVCSDCAVRGSCTNALADDCTELSGTRINVDEDVQCKEVAAKNIPDEATHAIIKASNDCWKCNVIDPTKDQTFCVDGDHAISHIEFAECPEPRVTDLTADCDTLTIETEDAVGDTIEVDFRLLLDGSEVVDPAAVEVTDDDDNGVYLVDLTGLTDDSYNQVEVESVTHNESGTDMLAEGGFSAPVTLSTGELCNPPAVTDLAADCDTLTVTTDHAVDDTITVDFRLLLDGNEVVDPGLVTVADADDGTADGVYHVDLTGYTNDSYNQVEVVSVTHDETGVDMLTSNFSAPVTLSTGELCNPPEVTDIATNCETIFIEVNDAAAGDQLSVDFKLDEIDETGSLVANDIFARNDVGTTADSTSNVATITIDDFTASTDLWNVVEITEVEHVDTGTQMLDEAVRELVVVNRTL